ncbi:MAG TPA: hypothetical protein VGW77_09800 [Candidatus Binatia bacterium]|jgi:hypothetical protein|nr:hypothetical protein [Candidatus Binatia bacterium]
MPNDTDFQSLLAVIRTSFQQLQDRLEHVLHTAAAASGRTGQSNGKKMIPGGLTLEDFVKIRDILRKILDETDAEIVNMRLNKTDKANAAPVFVGWVESERVKNLRLQRNEPDPGFCRLGDTVSAREYEETLNRTVKDQKPAILDRDWCDRLHEKSPEQKALVPRAGVMYQKLIGIVVDQGGVRHCVGTLNFGFNRPTDAQKSSVERRIKDLAQGEKSELSTYLKEEFNFEFGGPTL